MAKIAKDNLDGVRIVAARPFTAIQFAIENLLKPALEVPAAAKGKGNREYTFYRQGRLSFWSDR